MSATRSQVRVLAQLGVRRGSAAAALVEQHDAIFLRVEELPVPGLDAAAGAAVDKHDRLAFGTTAFLDINLVQRRNLDALAAIGLDGGVGGGHGLEQACECRSG